VVADTAEITEHARTGDAMNPEPERANGKPYEAPQLSEISLRPEEAVLGHCKNAVAVGPGQGTCNAIVPCGSIGS
jgi:hypothetical protein